VRKAKEASAKANEAEVMHLQANAKAEVLAKQAAI
jgi:hypothetical protein